MAAGPAHPVAAHIGVKETGNGLDTQNADPAVLTGYTAGFEVTIHRRDRPGSKA